MEVVLTFITATLLPALIKILIALVIYWIGSKLIKFVLNLTGKAMEKANLDAGVQSFLKSALKIVLFVVLVFAIVSYLGIATTGIAALFASAGVTVGLALQGSLSNLAGGVLILVLKPFKVGEYIIACGAEGTVTSIEILCTKLLTVDNKVVIIPNGSLANSNITNVSREEFRRVDLVFGVAYESDLKLVKNLLQQIGDRHELALHDEAHPVTVFINEFGASSIDFGFRVWCKNSDYWTVKWDLMEKVKDAFDANNIEIPFNQLDVHMQNQ
ncbi:MAG: mechanosensitive ion channel [Lachnospiraceae bacterium]|nr:mechanosensitive ion channel [Lachnospiraceae bacterium]